VTWLWRLAGRGVECFELDNVGLRWDADPLGSRGGVLEGSMVATLEGGGEPQLGSKRKNFTMIEEILMIPI
jgi:hypothetical protein